MDVKFLIFTIKALLENFVYNELENKGLYGLNGNLIIQPPWQRFYIYGDGKRDALVIDSIIKGISLGMLYFYVQPDGKYALLDGQQRLTSIGRYLTGKFSVDFNGEMLNFANLPEDIRERILNTELPVTVCTGGESSRIAWYERVNIAGVKMTQQEIRNSVFSGPFVEEMKKTFSNQKSALCTKLSYYMTGSPLRQDYMEQAIQWTLDATK